jgi:hypothetical protein
LSRGFGNAAESLSGRTPRGQLRLKAPMTAGTAADEGFSAVFGDSIFHF